MSLAKRLLHGTATNVLEHAVKILALFITTPLMVKHLGDQTYGRWLIVITISGYLRLLDFGVSLTATRFLGIAIGKGSKLECAEYITAFKYIFNRIALTALCLTAVLAFFFRETEDSDPTARDSQLVLIIFGSIVTLRFLFEVYSSVLKSHLRYDWIGRVSIGKTLVQTTIYIYLLNTDPDIVNLAIATLATEFGEQLLIYYLSNKHHRNDKSTSSPRKPKHIGEILRYSSTTTLAHIGSQLRTGIDPLVISSLLGYASVPIYSIGNRFIAVFSDLINAAFGGHFLAAFSQIAGRNDSAALNSAFITTLRLCTALATLLGTGMMIFAPLFIERWLGPRFQDSGDIVLILTPPTILMLAQYPAGNLLYSQNKQHLVAIIGFTSGVVNVALSIGLTLHMGFFGAIWGTFIEVILQFLVAIPLVASKTCGIPFFHYLLKILKHSIPFLILGSLFHLIFHQLLRPDYLNLLLYGVIFSLFSVFVLWIFTFSRHERTIIIKLIIPSFSK